MANNIDIKFSGLVELRAAKYLYTGTTPSNDCMRALLTDFYNSSYVYSPSIINGPSISQPEAAFNRDNSDYATFATNRTYIIQNHRIKVQAVVALISTNSAGTDTFSLNLKGLNESNTQFSEDISGNVTLQPIGSETLVVFNNLQEDYINLRRGWVQEIQLVPGLQDIRLYQLYVYGEVIEETQGKLPPTTGATTIESFTDSFLSISSLQEGSLVKDGSLLLEPRRAFTNKRVTLTGDYKIPVDSEVSVWNFDPNGSTRKVTLPKAPVFNHYIRINNLDGSKKVIVEDSDNVTVIQNLSNADGPNTLEAIWADTQWIITV